MRRNFYKVTVVPQPVDWTALSSGSATGHVALWPANFSAAGTIMHANCPICAPPRGFNTSGLRWSGYGENRAWSACIAVVGALPMAIGIGLPIDRAGAAEDAPPLLASRRPGGSTGITASTRSTIANAGICIQSCRWPAALPQFRARQMRKRTLSPSRHPRLPL